MEIRDILNERQETYGDFSDVSSCSQDLKRVIKSFDKGKIHPFQQEALDMICNKIARIVCGDVLYIENFRDIAGYATLCVDIMRGTSGSTDAKVVKITNINGVSKDGKGEKEQVG